MVRRVALPTLLFFACAAPVARTRTLPVAPEASPATAVAARGMSFAVRMAGPSDGPVVLLLHGFPQTSYQWRHQLAALVQAGFRVIAPDQRGYSPGARPPSVEDYAMPLLVGDVLALADALGIQRFHVVGHDWGAAVAWGLALFAPERVISLTSVSIPHPGALSRELADDQSCQHRASAYFDLFIKPDSEDLFLKNDAFLLRAAWSHTSDDAVASYLRVLGNKPALRAAMNWYRANLDQRQVRSVDVKAKVPTLLVWSDKDPFICRASAERTKDFIDAPYRFEVLHNIGHFIPEMAAEKLSALLLEHLR